MKFFTLLIISAILSLHFSSPREDHQQKSGKAGIIKAEVHPVSGAFDDLFNSLTGDRDKLSRDVFNLAYTGYRKLLSAKLISKSNLLTIIDFSRASREKRLWVIDLTIHKILYHELVAHGKNSGMQYASKFSNIPETNMSSLGFYVTGKTYTGKHGLSLYLDGMEKDFNNNASARSIVMHPATYVSTDFIRKYGRIGRSFGCPSLPVNMAGDIIETLKEGSCLFIYYPDENYLANSMLLRETTIAKYSPAQETSGL